MNLLEYLQNTKNLLPVTLSVLGVCLLLIILIRLLHKYLVKKRKLNEEVAKAQESLANMPFIETQNDQFLDPELNKQTKMEHELATKLSESQNEQDDKPLNDDEIVELNVENKTEDKQNSPEKSANKPVNSNNDTFLEDKKQTNTATKNANDAPVNKAQTTTKTQPTEVKENGQNKPNEVVNKPKTQEPTKAPTQTQPVQNVKPVEQKVEPKAEQKVETKVEPKVEQKVETKVEPKAEQKVETKVEPKVEQKTEQKVEKQPEKTNVKVEEKKKPEKFYPKVDREPAPQVKYAGKWLIYTEDGKYAANLVASNGEILLRSEQYTALSGVKSGIETLKNNIAKNNFAISVDKNGKFFFKLYSSSTRLLCMSESYSTKAICENAIESVKRFAKTAVIEVKKDEE